MMQRIVGAIGEQVVGDYIPIRTCCTVRINKPACFRVVVAELPLPSVYHILTIMSNKKKIPGAWCAGDNSICYLTNTRTKEHPFLFVHRYDPLYNRLLYSHWPWPFVEGCQSHSVPLHIFRHIGNH